jgi:hypothetical protein
MQNLRKMKGRGAPLLKESWVTYKRDLDSIINELKENQNIRVHDSETGGVLRGHSSSRKKNKELWDNQNKFVGLLCRVENLNGEVGYSRALFNQKNMAIEDKKSGNIQRMNLLAYEAPLLRKQSDGLNTDIDSKFAKCDLIGLYDNYLYAIEVKIKPEEYSTYLPHAMVESFAYGYYLNKIIEEESIRLFNSEIRLCLKSFHPNSNILAQDSYQVKYIVAAPRGYFARYFYGKNKSQEWYRLRISEVKKIEKLLFNEGSSSPKFSGYLIMENSHNDVIDKFNSKSKICLPNFNSPLSVASLYPDFSTLKSGLAPHL